MPADVTHLANSCLYFEGQIAQCMFVISELFPELGVCFWGEMHAVQDAIIH